MNQTAPSRQQVAPRQGQQVSRQQSQKQTAVAVIDDLRRTLEQMRPQFQMALGSEDKANKFVRVVMTAVQNSPKLLQCDRRSLLNAAMKAAQDDLLPDGREGAIVPFAENEDGQKKSDQCQWMPMVAGLRKKVRKSGEIADWWCEVVREGDDFDYQLGDDPHIQHRPGMGPDREGREITHAYSICKFKDGTLSREVMAISEIIAIRDEYSRAKRGPWANKVAFPEMCKKTVARRHFKTLPSSTDIDQVLHRDDVFYNPEGGGIERERRQARITAGVAARVAPRPSNANAALAQFGNGNDDAGEAAAGEEDPRPGDGEVIENENPAPDNTQNAQAEAAETFADLIRKANKNAPKDLSQFGILTRMLIDAARNMGAAAGVDALTAWWPSEGARRLRNTAGMTSEDTALVLAEVKAAVDELKGTTTS